MKDTILLVEKSVELLDSIEKFFEPHFHVLTAQTASRAEWLLDRVKIDCAFVDFFLGEDQPMGSDLIVRWKNKYEHLSFCGLCSPVKVPCEDCPPEIDVVIEKSEVSQALEVIRNSFRQ